MRSGKMIDVKYQGGTMKAPQQTKITASAFTATDKVQFVDDGRLTTILPWSDVTPSSPSFLGACRSIHGVEIGQTGFYYYFGTHTSQYLLRNETLTNISPFADQKSELLGDNPLDVHSGSATMDINWTAHGLTVGDEITLSGSTTVDAVDATTYINIAHRVVTIVSADKISVTLGTTAGSTTSGGGSAVVATAIGRTAVLGANPISVTNGSPTVTVTYTAHGLSAGQRIKLNFATATGGITAAMLNKEHIVVTVPTADTFTITASGNASSTTTGGGSVVSIFTQMAAGNLDQANASGYGYGLYGAGTYGTPKTSISGLQSYPRTWSYGDFGSDIVMNAGDFLTGDGQKIYIHDGSTSVAPTVLTNAPTDCNYVSVVNNAVVALCGTRIDISDLGDATVWDAAITNTAYSVTLQNVSRLISCVPIGDKQALIYSFNEVFLLTYVGGADRWDIRQLPSSEGMIAPQAWAKINSVIYWLGFYNIYRFSGSVVETIPNEFNGEWISQNINRAQHYKCFATADVNDDQIFFHFPTGANLEPSDYAIHAIDKGFVTLGTMLRTGAMKRYVGQKHYYAYGNSASVAGNIYIHFVNDGSLTFAWSATMAEAYLGDGDKRYAITDFFPDANMEGNITLTVTCREYAQDTVTYTQTYTITSTTQWITIRAAGRLVSLTFSGNYQTTMGIPKMAIKQLGDR